MRFYKVTGFVMPKEQEDKGWQKIRDGIKIQLPDFVDPYDAISKSFKLEASRWMFTIDEISEEEARGE